MTPEERTRRIANLVPALWRTEDQWHWDVMDVSTGNMVGSYGTWTELTVDFPEFAEAM